MDGNDLAELLRRGKVLRWERRYAEAATVFEELVREARLIGHEDWIADGLGWLAIVRSFMRSPDRSLSEILAIQHEVLAIDTRNHGPDHLRVADGLRCLAGTMEEMGSEDDAIEHLRRASAIYRAHAVISLGREDALSRLVGLLHERSAFQEAVERAREHVAVCESLEHPVRLTHAVFALGRALLEAGSPRAAIDSFERARDLAAPRIAEGRAWRLGPDLEQWITRARAAADAAT